MTESSRNVKRPHVNLQACTSDDAMDPTCTDATPGKSSVSKFAENLALKTPNVGMCTKEARAFSYAVKKYSRRVTPSSVRNNNPKNKGIDARRATDRRAATLDAMGLGALFRCMLFTGTADGIAKSDELEFEPYDDDEVVKDDEVVNDSGRSDAGP